MLLELSHDCDQDHPSTRILISLMQIAKFGPITLTDLVKHVDFGRSSLHRSCEKLEKFGWIRRRPADKAYQLSQSLDTFLAVANYATFEETFVEELFVETKSAGMFHATLSAFTHTGVFIDIESTKPISKWQKKHSLVFSPPAIMAQTLLSPKEKLQNLLSFLKSANAEEEQIIKSKEHTQNVLVAERAGICWSPGKDAFSLPWLSPTGLQCSITLELRDVSVRKLGLLKAEVVKVSEIFQTGKNNKGAVSKK